MFLNYRLMYPQASRKAVKLFLKFVVVKMVSKLKIFIFYRRVIYVIPAGVSVLLYFFVKKFQKSDC